MLFQQNRTVPRYIAIFYIPIFGVLTSFLLSCNRFQGGVAPDAVEISDGAPTVKIGFIYSSPDPGTTRNGAELAVTLANAAGGINGLPIELLIRDDKGDTLRSVQHAEALIAAGVSAIVGPDYSRLAVQVGAVVQRHGIPMVTTYPTHPDVPRNGNFSFMGAYIDPYQASIMVDFAIQELQATTAAVLTETGNAYSEGLSNTFVADFTEQGGTVVSHQFYETGTTDFNDQLMAIAAVEPAVDVVFLPGLGPEFPLAVKQARSDDIGISATFLGGDGWDRPDLIEIGGMALEGSFFANHFSPDDQSNEAARQFVNAYTQKYGIAPDGPAALGYDAATLIVAAMRRATDLTPAAIRDQIEETQDYSGATMLSHFDENRHAIKSAVINTIKDGKIQLHQLFVP